MKNLNIKSDYLGSNTELTTDAGIRLVNPESPYIGPYNSYDLWDYQVGASKKVDDEWLRNRIAILAMCPSAGKTKTALKKAFETLISGGRVLILAHGTNVLKNQWSDELKQLGAPFSASPESKESLVVSIPQSVIGKIENETFDLLIVDEAHEFYYADTVQNIIKSNNFKKELLLTGTPSIFIQNGHKPVIVSGTTVYEKGKLSNAYIGLVKSSYSITDDDYNKMTNDADNKKLTNVKETERTLDALLKEMLIRIKSSTLNASPNALNLLNLATGDLCNSYKSTFGTLEKTMIAARSIQQGRHIMKYLQKNGVETLMSDSDNDPSSENIEHFKNNPKIKVLVTVKRGILGFNMPELVNVVDFSCTRDIDRIYQLYARVLRKHPQNKRKFFFRVVSKVNPAVDSFYTQAAICLNSADFISKYNKKNLKSLEIIQSRPKSTISTKGEKGKARGNHKASDVHSINIEFFNDIISLGMMNELSVKRNSDLWNEYEYVNFGEAMDKLRGKTFEGDPVLQKKIISRLKKRKDLVLKSDPEKLILTLKEMATPGNQYYCEKTHQEVVDRYPYLLAGRSEYTDDIIQYLISKNRYPTKAEQNKFLQDFIRKAMSTVECLDPFSNNFDIDLFYEKFKHDQLKKDFFEDDCQRVIDSCDSENSRSEEIISRILKSREKHYEHPNLTNSPFSKIKEVFLNPFNLCWTLLPSGQGRNTGYSKVNYFAYISSVNWDNVKDIHYKFIDTIDPKEMAKFNSLSELGKSKDKKHQCIFEYLQTFIGGYLLNFPQNEKSFNLDVCKRILEICPQFVEASAHQKLKKDEARQKLRNSPTFRPTFNFDEWDDVA